MFNLINLITTAGYVGLFGIVFAESGLLVGFFLPGDSLLFTAGFLASQGFLNVWLLAPLLFVAAVTGDSVGYWFGHKVGPKIFKKEDSLFFHKDHLRKADIFFKAHGGKTIILARFLPVVRTFAPILAGVGNMRYSKFLFYNLTGGFLWTFGLIFVGYFLGKTIPGVDKYLLPIIAVIIILSIAPTAWQILKDKEFRVKLWNRLKNILQNKKQG